MKSDKRRERKWTVEASTGGDTRSAGTNRQHVVDGRQ